MVVDWITVRTKASGGEKYVLVVGWVQTGAIFALGSKLKKDAVVPILEAAREAFGLQDQRIIVHSDGERVLDGPEVREYLTSWAPDQPGGSTHHGVPYHSNSNAYVENFIRKLEDGVRCTLVQSGLPPTVWPAAVEAWCVGHNASLGVQPRINTTTIMPFGCFGSATLPQKLLFTDKFASRTVGVCYLGINRKSSGGVKIMFRGSDGKFRRSTVMARDVLWEPECSAFVLTQRNLEAIHEAIPEMCSLNPISRFQAQCDLCSKWRWIFFDPDRLVDRDFCCQNVGMKCADNEDERVHAEFSEEELRDFGVDVTNTVTLDFEEECNLCDVGVPDEEESGYAVARSARSDILYGLKTLNKNESDEQGSTTCGSEHESDGGATGSDEPPNTDEFEVEAALMRLGMKEIDDHELNRLRKIARRECAAEKNEGAIARVIVVSTKEALDPNNPERAGWIGAMGEEVQSLLDQFKTLRVASVDEVQKGDQVLPSILIFTRKPCGRLKARIVAAGNFETVSEASSYSSVVGHDSWLQMVLMNQKMGGSMYQIDVKNAFLQAEGGPEGRDPITGGRTYVKPPRAVGASDKVLWQVIGSLYGLRSAPSSWKKTLVSWLVDEEQGFRVCTLDDSVYLGPDGLKVLVYVDDIIVLGESSKCIQFLQKMRKKFVCTEWISLDSATRASPLMFLGHEMFLEINNYGKEELIVSQNLYARVLLARLGFEDCKGLKTLLSEDFYYDALHCGEKASAEDHRWFRGVCGGVNYLALGTRPDILSIVSILAEGQAAPTVNHIAAAKKLLRWLAGVSQFELRLNVDRIEPRSVLNIEAQYDACFLCERARTGITIFLNGALSFWSSKRQKCITLSTAEAELVACAAGTKELIGVRNFLAETFGQPGHGELTFSLSLRGDNSATTAISKSQASVRRVRHLKLSDLYCKDVIASEGIVVTWISTDLNCADALTKVLGYVKAEIARRNLGLVESRNNAAFAYRGIVENSRNECLLWACI